MAACPVPASVNHRCDFHRLCMRFLGRVQRKVAFSHIRILKKWAIQSWDTANKYRDYTGQSGFQFMKNRPVQFCGTHTACRRMGPEDHISSFKLSSEGPCPGGGEETEVWSWVISFRSPFISGLIMSAAVPPPTAHPTPHLPGTLYMPMYISCYTVNYRTFWNVIRTRI